MGFKLFLVFTVIPVVELYVIIKVGHVIGPLNTIVLLILTGMSGAYLARSQGGQVLRRIEESISRGIMPTEEMIDGAMVLAGGILLLTPGFLTDLFGLALLIPITRVFVKLWLKQTLKNYIRVDSSASGKPPHFHDDIEDAEFH